MMRTTIILLLGLLVGVTSHELYFHARQPLDTNSLDGQLAWMKSELDISDQQMAQIKALHEASAPRMRALATQVTRMQQELQAFEDTRRTAGQVNFIEFAQFVETRRNVNQACLDSTRQLVLASAEIMNATQRQQYLGMISAAIPLNDLSIQ
ncbi:MAG: hypothetical protein K9M98_14185 [Cephaloticoccus sp.]|nr:hypothetical protein [Cephaloticoccus sp.]MCF7761644.1 hypothetical protein [Cephaloticoccus sp.]